MRRICVLAAPVLLCLACGPAPAPPETEILEVVLQTMASAVGSQSPRTILERVGHDFSTPDGIDFGGVQALVLEFLMRDLHYEAEIESLQIEDAPDQTSGDEPARRVRAIVRFTGSAEAGRSWASRYRLDLVFRQQLGQWTARSASYERLTPTPGAG